MRTFALFVVMIFLAGCVTQAERAAQVQRDVDDMIRVYGPGCEKLGYKPDSDLWRDCVLRMSNKDAIAHSHARALEDFLPALKPPGPAFFGIEPQNGLPGGAGRLMNADVLPDRICQIGSERRMLRLVINELLFCRERKIA